MNHGALVIGSSCLAPLTAQKTVMKLRRAKKLDRNENEKENKDKNNVDEEKSKEEKKQNNMKIMTHTKGREKIKNTKRKQA